MSKHTPGPWVAAPYQGFGPFTTVRQGDARTGLRIASTFETTSPEHIERNEANARLIAAAPELLEALELLLSYTLTCEAMLNSKPAGQIDIARAAITKATGEHHDN